MRCKFCGTECADGTQECPGCGATLPKPAPKPTQSIQSTYQPQQPAKPNSQAQQSAYQPEPVQSKQPVYQPAQPAQQTYQPQQPLYQPQQNIQIITPNQSGTKKTGGASLVFGLLSFFTSWGIVLGFIFGALGIKYSKDVDDSYAKVGKVFGILGIILNAIVLFIYICMGAIGFSLF